MLLALGAAVLSVEAQPRSKDVDGGTNQRRFAPDSAWTVVWSRGFKKEEDLFVEPRALAHTGRLISVLDVGTRDVLMLDPATGATKGKIVPRQGSGPGEFRRPTGLVPIVNGFVVSDAGNARLSAFDESGKLKWDTPIPDPFISDFCVASDFAVLMKRDGVANALELRDSTGKLVSTRSLDWSHNPEEAFSTKVRAVGMTNKGECVLARIMGADWVVVPRSGKVRNYQFVEKMPDPVVRVKERVLEAKGRTKIVERMQTTKQNSSAMNVMLRGDTLIVRFSGNSADRIRLLDYYDVNTGRYIHSRKLPSYFVSATVGPDGTFYLGQIRDEDAGVVALRPVMPTAKATSTKKPPATPSGER